ncbi:putative L-iditol 2-dehydrogenase [Helianthus anomalus]
MMHTEENEQVEEMMNMAAWLLGIKNLQIQPYHLPPLGPCFPKLPYVYKTKFGGIVTHSCVALSYWTILFLILFYSQFKIRLSSFV